MLKNIYYSRYGNTDIDVLGISIIKIDDLLDYYMRLAYVNYKEVR